MNKLTTLIVMSVLLFSCTEKEKHSTKSHSHKSAQSSEVDARVNKILSGLSLEDKCGEMTQLNLDLIMVGQPYNLEKPNKIDPAKLKKVLVDLKVGSILNNGGQAYTKERWHEIIGEIQRVATQEKPSGIPVLYGIDAIHGVNYTLNNSLFPQQIGLAATWNPELAYEMGRVSAYETRASCIPWTFSPVLDIARDPRWPRHWETFGEDPHLLSEMGEQVVKGYQGTDVSDNESVAACLKHFLGYSTPLSGKDRTPAWIPDRQLREYFLPGFKKAIESGAKTIMVNSGEVNGIPVHANPVILTELLRKELGFEGLVVTDWEDILYLRDRHRVAKDYKEAIKLAINAGIDMSMVPVDYEFPVLLKELVEDGEISESRLDESVRRILKLKVELGLFESPITNLADYPEFGGEKHALSALNAARESMTLLKNEKSTLPLEAGKVLLTGPMANTLTGLIGGWGRTWQGVDPQYNHPDKKTIFQAMDEDPDLQVILSETSLDPQFDEIYKALRFSKNLNTAIVCIGEMPYTETVGDIEDINIPKGQIELVKQLSESVDEVIVVIVEGRPRIISELEPYADAIIQAYLPGNEGAKAIVEVIKGEVNPSGKLPYTYPRYASSHTCYDYKGTDEIDPQFGRNAFNPQYEFGFGLSYSSFEYSNLKVSRDTVAMGDEFIVFVEVKNTSQRDGQEVVQLYVRDEVASITPGAKRLRAFNKIDIPAGKSKQLEFNLSSKDLEFAGIDLEFVCEPGDFTVMIDTLTAPFYIK